MIPSEEFLVKPAVVHVGVLLSYKSFQQKYFVNINMYSMFIINE